MYKIYFEKGIGNSDIFTLIREDQER